MYPIKLTMITLSFLFSTLSWGLEYSKPPSDYEYGKFKSSKPRSSLDQFKVKCDAPPKGDARKSLTDYEKYLFENRIKLINPEVTLVDEVQNFLFEFEKFPKPLLAEMIKQKARIYLIHGNSVMDDPKWDPKAYVPQSNDSSERNPLLKTWDGRDWSVVNGAGGMPFAEEIQREANRAKNDYNKTMRDYCSKYPKMENCSREKIAEYNIEHYHIDVSPTRVVINNMYPDLSGTVNLFLHEHGHSLDSLYAFSGISSSTVWAQIMTAPNFKNFTTKLCPNAYCFISPAEGFAELFAYYNACSASRQHMEKDLPEAADFFSRFHSAKRVMDDSKHVREVGL